MVLKAAGDRNRLRILKMLGGRKMCVCELTAVLGITQPSVSRHLRMLKDAGLVQVERDGQWINYRLNNETGDGFVRDMLTLVDRWLGDDPQILEDHEQARRANRNELICDGSRRTAR
jgi:ArsR family transcriptional regulator